MKRISFILGLAILIAQQLPSFAAGLIIVHDPELPEPPSRPPSWPTPPPHHPPHHPWLPRPIHRFTPLEVRSLQAHAKIDDQVAETRIEQEFYNPNARQLEGTFILPLPKGAHLGRFRMEVNGKMADAELLAADKARETYEEIVRKVKDPALLEYVGRDLLKVRIFPIEPHSTKRIELSYSQVLAADGGLANYTLPLNVAKHSSGPIQNFSLKLELTSATSLKTLYSPSHSIEVLRHDPKSVTIGLEEKTLRPTQDFQFFYSMEPRELGLDFLTYKKPGEDGYFMLIASPGMDHASDKIVPKDVVFVLDTSGSMNGQKIEQARNALSYCVNSLNDADRFEVVRFSTEARQLFHELREVSSESKKKAAEFVQDLRAAGGTAINDALLKALSLRPENSQRPYIVVFLTDGQPTVGVTKEDAILENVRSKNRGLTRVFCFGLGTDVNTHLLDKIAEETGAITQYVLPEEDIEVKVSSFFAKINEPVLAGVQIDFGGISTSQIHPGKLPDLFKGQQLIVLGRYQDSGKTTARLTGSVDEQKKSFSYTLGFPREATTHEFIPRLWATRRVGYLLDQMRLHGDSQELKDEVTELARQFGIVTPYTSYLVTEDQPSSLTSNRRPQLSQSLPSPKAYHDTSDLGRRYLPQRAERLAEAGPAAQASSPAGPRHQRLMAPAPARTGDSAVLNSRYSLALKSSERLGDEAQAGLPGAQGFAEAGRAQLRFAGGRTFYSEDGVWVDGQIASLNEPPVLRIKFDSPEYYALAAGHPIVRDWLALGTRVKFLWEGRVYEIVPSE